MKRAVRVVLLAAAIAQGAPAVAAPLSTSPLVGTWALEVSRMTIPPNQRPKSVTIKFSDAGDDRLTTQVEILGGDGSAIHASSTCPLDGTPTAATVVGPEGDKVSVMTPAPNVLVMALSKDGKARSIRTFTVAPDGRSLSETATYLGDGLPGMGINYFRRIR
jgi:hypothetical protein